MQMTQKIILIFLCKLCVFLFFWFFICFYIIFY